MKCDNQAAGIKAEQSRVYGARKCRIWATVELARSSWLFAFQNATGTLTWLMMKLADQNTPGSNL